MSLSERERSTKMSRKHSESSKRSARGTGIIPTLCNIFGILILVSVIGSALAVTVPRFMGYDIYNVVSPSMEPEIPVGSVIYVKEAEPEDIKPGEVIAFNGSSFTVVHRVVENRTVEGTFTTKGDANEKEDVNAVEYSALIGRVTAHFPILGGLMEIYCSTVGKAYAICFAACGAMLNILASRLRDRKRSLLKDNSVSEDGEA